MGLSFWIRRSQPVLYLSLWHGGLRMKSIVTPPSIWRAFPFHWSNKDLSAFSGMKSSNMAQENLERPLVLSSQPPSTVMKPILIGVQGLAHWHGMANVDILHMILLPWRAGSMPKKVDVMIIQIHGLVETPIRQLILCPKSFRWAQEVDVWTVSQIHWQEVSLHHLPPSVALKLEFIWRCEL